MSTRRMSDTAAKACCIPERYCTFQHGLAAGLVQFVLLTLFLIAGSVPLSKKIFLNNY